MRKVNVLLTAAGTMKGPTVIALLKKQKDYKVEITACDLDPLSAGLYFADSHHLVPRADDPNYVPSLLAICQKDKIEVLIPLLSKELPVISRNQRLFEKVGTKVVVAEWPAIRTSQDKWRTHLFFKKNKVPTPETWLPRLLPQRLKFPLMVKPRISSGTKNVVRVENRSQLLAALRHTNDPVVQKYIEGQEYTIDLVAASNGRLIGSVPRIRIKVMDGKSVTGRTVRHPRIVDFVRKIVRALKFYGPANIQCIETETKELYFTEVNPRLAAGGLPLAVAAGLDIPLICLKLALGDTISTPPTIKKNVYMLRYLDEIFVKEEEGRFIRL